MPEFSKQKKDSDGELFSLNDFHFDLPDELIAQYPSDRRDRSRLLVLDRRTSGLQHRFFFEIGQLLNSGDVLVINNVKVAHSRSYFLRDTGAIVEIVFNSREAEKTWNVICNKTKRLKPGEILVSSKDSSISIKIIKRINDHFLIETNNELTEDVLMRIGDVPLPPYIKRKADTVDDERYRTVYSDSGYAAAAPTAGFHFTLELMTELKKAGVIFVPLTLEVSWDTFRPVRDNDLSKHKMHGERFYLPEKSAGEINRAREEGRRIIAVGTTSLRALESTLKDGKNIPGNGETDIFIYPPYKIRSIDGIITNFHTPYSTLLMLVSAFAGYDNLMTAYKEAVRERYRFFSYGDAMFIL